MDPVTAIVMVLIGGVFAANRLVSGTRKLKDAGPEPVKQNEPAQERMGGGDRGQPRSHAGDEAHQLPVEHLPVVEMTVVRDRATGKFTRKPAAPAPQPQPQAAPAAA